MAIDTFVRVFALKSDASDFKHGAKVLLFFEVNKVLQIKDITKISTVITRYITDNTDIKKASQLLVKLS